MTKNNTITESKPPIKISKKYIVECLGYGEIDIKLVESDKKVLNK